LVRLINTEKRNALAGKPAYIYLKLNSLVDNDLITKLYQASKASVKIKLNIRGISSIIAGVEGLSENIEAISILDKFLEHSRIYVFCNNDNPKYYISSADWMVRNLDRRIEVTCPIYDKDIQQEIQDFLDIQFKDNVKARSLDKRLSNKYRDLPNDKPIRAQFALYDYYKSKLN
jgi:polyphosphate kinase